MLRLRERKVNEIMAFSLLVTTVLLGLVLFFFDLVVSPIDANDVVVVNIPKGTSTTRIGGILQEEGVIKNAFFFRILVSLQKKDGFLQSGYYSFAGGADIFKVIGKLRVGNVLTYKITVPEGFTLEEVAELFAENGKVAKDEFIKTAQTIALPYSYLPGADNGGDYRLQGYLFPATYTLPLGAGSKEIIKVMVERFDTELTEEIQRQAEKLGMSIHELIIIASIIEKEAKLDEERVLVSAVIHNRLKQGMYLQSCATVQYALPQWKAQLLYDDLRFNSPYNTYLHPGLPPGPIANPGEASLRAAFYPADVDFLFFVALPDGSHQFSKSYQEHLRYQLH